MGAFGWEGWLRRQSCNQSLRAFWSAGLMKMGKAGVFRAPDSPPSGSAKDVYSLVVVFFWSVASLIHPFFFSPNYKSQLNKCLKSKSKIKWNPLLVEPSHFKVANTFQAIFLVLPDISMSHSSLSSLYNDLEHMRRIWIYLVKCFFNQVSLPTKILHA